MALLLRNIHRLYRIAENGETQKAGLSMQDACVWENAWVRLEGEKIHSLGLEPFHGEFEGDEMDCTGRCVFPGFVDSHTHLVFARTRESEFVDKIKGLSYEEIAARGGGILNSARALREMDEEELLQRSLVRAYEILGMGTTTVEIKSGYGLTTEAEMKMLRVARKIGEITPLRVKTSFLGAHAYPMEYRENKPGYIRLIIEEMLPRVVSEGLADYVDAFCEKGFFSVEDTRLILEAAGQLGLKAKIHANQLSHSGGVELGVEMGAVSVDHLECVGEAEILALQKGKTIPTVLPSAAFFLRAPYPPARAMMEAGLPVCIASDYNPGSTPCGNMSFEMALACVQMRMLPEEALVASTLNGAAALELGHVCGSIEVGKAADIVITEPMDSIALIPYFFGRLQIGKVIAAGVLVVDKA